jgi:hypothetical protein
MGVGNTKGRTMTEESLLISIIVPVDVTVRERAHRPSGREGKAHGERSFAR